MDAGAGSHRQVGKYCEPNLHLSFQVLWLCLTITKVDAMLVSKETACGVKETIWNALYAAV